MFWEVTSERHAKPEKAKTPTYTPTPTVSTTASPSPLGLQWKYHDGSGIFHLNPLLTVTEISADELAAVRVAADSARIHSRTEKRGVRLNDDVAAWQPLSVLVANEKVRNISINSMKAPPFPSTAALPQYSRFFCSHISLLFLF